MILPPRDAEAEDLAYAAYEKHLFEKAVKIWTETPIAGDAMRKILKEGIPRDVSRRALSHAIKSRSL